MFTPSPDGRLKVSPLAPPMQAKEMGELPYGEDWVYEYCWSGERVRAIKHDGGVHLISRDGRELTNRFPRIAACVAKLRATSVTLDGEILYLDLLTDPALKLLARTADEFSHAGLALLVYDVLSDEGKDVRLYSLLCRRLLLASIIQAAPIVLSPWIDGDAQSALASATRLGLRGVIAKRAGSAYRPNSLTSDWVKKTLPADPPRLVTRNPFTGEERDKDLAGAPAGVS